MSARELLIRLQSTEPESRREALDELAVNPESAGGGSGAGGGGGEIAAVAGRLRELLLSGAVSDPERQSAATALGALGCDAILLELTTHESPVTRGHVATGLGRSRSEASLLPLIELLQDSVNTVRNLAERALIARLEDVRRSGVPRLLELLDHPEPLTHSPAARLLGQTQDPRALQPLIALATSGEKWLSRVWGAKSLGDLGLADAVPPLIRALKEDEKNRVRAAAAAALGELRMPAAAESLRVALSDDDEGVQSAARDALDRLQQSGQTEAQDPFEDG